jgi:hypothetical protein
MKNGEKKSNLVEIWKNGLGQSLLVRGLPCVWRPETMDAFEKDQGCFRHADKLFDHLIDLKKLRWLRSLDLIGTVLLGYAQVKC